MRNTGSRLLRLSVGVCVAVLLAGPAAAQNTDQQFTGSWIHYLNVSGTSSGPLLPALVTIQSDGTMIISSGLMFGSPSMPAAPVRYSPLHFVWEKAGPKTITGTGLFFVFDPDGKMHSYQRNRFVIQLSNDRDTYTGLIFLDELHCPNGVFSCPYPQDPSATWTPNPNMPAGGYLVTGKRLKVVPYPAS